MLLSCQGSLTRPLFPEDFGPRRGAVPSAALDAKESRSIRETWAQPRIPGNCGWEANDAVTPLARILQNAFGKAQERLLNNLGMAVRVTGFRFPILAHGSKSGTLGHASRRFRAFAKLAHGHP